MSAPAAVFDRSSPEGQRVVELYADVRHWEHPDGSWGPDVVDVLTRWFASLGFEVPQ